MSPLIRALRAFILLAVTASVIGCGGSTTPTSAPTRTPAEHFRQEQANTMTPHGRIDTGSVTEQDGKIGYRTEDGKRWEVDYSKRADGTYQYGTPSEVTK